MPTVFIGEASRRWAHDLDDLRARWQIRREPPTPDNWMPVEEFQRVVATMTREQLVELRAPIVAIQHTVMQRLSRANADVRKHQHYLDPEEFMEMQRARQAVGRHVVVINDQLHTLSLAARKASTENFGQRFIQIARAELEPETFERIYAMAHVPPPGGEA